MIIIFWRYAKLYALGFFLIGAYWFVRGIQDQEAGVSVLSAIFMAISALFFYVARNSEPNFLNMIKLSLGIWR